MKRMYRQDWVPSIFNDFFDTNWMGRTKATAPAINVIEKSDEYKVQVAAPGMTRDDFRIHRDEAGDLVITSGSDSEGLFPEGLVIGTITEVRAESSGLSLYAVVEPAVSISELRDVYVITEFLGQGEVIG